MNVSLRVHGMVRALVSAAVMIACVACSDTPTTSTAAAAVRTSSRQLSGGAASIDALLDQFVQAVAANDAAGLQRLRVTEAEYRQIIIPWTVEEGQPPRNIPEESASLYWRMLDTKSRDMSRFLLEQFGGKPLTRKAPTYTKGVQKYAGYTAYGQVRLPVTDDHGQELLLRTGTIAEVSGQYKFIGLNWND
jgi:hypothetical protein